MSSITRTPDYDFRLSHTRAQFYGPSRQDSRPTLSAAPDDAIYRVMEMDPSSALALAVACRALTPLAQNFILINTADICRLPWSNHCGLGKNVLYFKELLIANDGEHRSCIMFHWSNVRIIRDLGFPCHNRILTPREMVLNDILVSGIETVRTIEDQFARSNAMWNNVFASLRGVATPSAPQAEDVPPSDQNNNVNDVD